MKFSIITAVRNNKTGLLRAIECVRKQTYGNVEHIVVDGVSTDGTIEVLNQNPHLTWISEPDNGQSDALNKGFHLAKGDIVGWLNADEKYLPTCFESVSRFFEEKPEVDILFGDCRWINESGLPFQLRRVPKFDLFTLKYHHVLYVHTVATFIRRKIFDDGNFLDVNYHYAMDYEFFLRLALRGYRFDHIPKLLGDFRWHEQCKSDLHGRDQFMERENALMRLDPLFNGITRPLTRKALRIVLKILARAKYASGKLMRGYYFSQWIPAKYNQKVV